MSESAEVIELYVELGFAGDESLKLRMTPKFADEVLALLDEHGIAHGRGAEFSAGTDLWIEGVQVLGAAGGLAALATVINTFIRRHDGKKIVIERGGARIEAAGLSEKAVERFLEKRAEEQATRDVEWDEIVRRDS